MTPEPPATPAAEGPGGVTAPTAGTADLLRSKRTLKTKLTKCRVQLAKSITRASDVGTVETAIDVIDRLHSELHDCINALIINVQDKTSTKTNWTRYSQGAMTQLALPPRAW